MRMVMVASVALAFACGASDAEEETMTTEEEHTSGSEEHVEREDDVQITGLMGTISREAVQRSIEPRMNSFLRCFMTRYDSVEVLGGRIELAFRIDVQGNVLWVYPRSSTVGDRATERCLVETASRIHFSRPQGGEAEFAYPLELDPPEDVRPAISWDGTRVADAVSSQRGSVSCGSGRFEVTVYVSPGGAVLSAGASTADQQRAESLDCVADAVSGWQMPDPGSYPAKVTFSL